MHSCRSIKQGKVVIVLNGRFAGRKAVVIKTYDEGHGARKFGHALVAGIDRAPRRLKRSLSDKKKVRPLPPLLYRFLERGKEERA